MFIVKMGSIALNTKRLKLGSGLKDDSTLKLKSTSA